MLVRLGDAVSPTCGGKAGTLGALLRAGQPVPDGFVIPFAVYRAVIDDRIVDATLREAIARGLDLLGDGPVAVRSSADDEDTVRTSAAASSSVGRPRSGPGTSFVTSRAPRRSRRVRLAATARVIVPSAATWNASGVTVPPTTLGPRPQDASISVPSAGPPGVNITPDTSATS